MSILDTIGGILSNAASSLHIHILSGNNTSNSPKTINKQKVVDKSRDKTVTSIKIDNSVKNFYVLQVPSFTACEIPSELAPLVSEYNKKGIAYVAFEQQQEVTDVLTFEQDQHINGLLKFFKDKLIPRDYVLLRTGLYLKHLRDNNQEEARKQWKRIKLNNTTRDRRVINLAGADYFNTYFRPLYKELQKEKNCLSNFRKQFDDIIDDMHFVVFVGADMSVGEIIRELTEKTSKNIRYGIKDDIIYIHAAGNSTVILEKSIEELRLIFPDIKVKRNIRSGKKLIKVSVWYRINKLDK